MTTFSQVHWWRRLLALYSLISTLHAQLTAPGLNILEPENGAEFPTGANIRIVAVATNPDSDIRLVNFYANGKFIGKANHYNNKPREHFFDWVNVPSGSYEVVAKASSGTPVGVISPKIFIKIGGNPRTAILVPWDAVWRHYNGAESPPTNWNSLNFTDTNWLVAPAKFPYGRGDKATRTGAAGKDVRPITAYFRNAFEISDPHVQKLVLKLVHDDGAAVYLNGVPLVCNNMPTTRIRHTTLPVQNIGADDAHTLKTITLLPTALKTGRNVLAVEVHQAAVASSNRSFTLQLSAVEGIPDLRVPYLSIIATRPETTEPTRTSFPSPGVFTVTRDSGIEYDLRVFLEFQGTAQFGEDYRNLIDEIVFRPGEKTVKIFVVGKYDQKVEPMETVIANFRRGGGFCEGEFYSTDPAHPSAVVRIRDSSRGAR